VVLTDGSRIATDFVVVCIGAAPNTQWLNRSSTALGNGVLCDEHGRTSGEDVWAVGDVAAWKTGERYRRTEHWNNVAGQVARIVPQVLGLDVPEGVPTIPYIWSDQYDLKLQILGQTIDKPVTGLEQVGSCGLRRDVFPHRHH
jgi:3-phenylpropionate/trans-cinnamate dioxygenase ferredoxin reductase subunit